MQEFSRSESVLRQPAGSVSYGESPQQQGRGSAPVSSVHALSCPSHQPQPHLIDVVLAREERSALQQLGQDAAHCEAAQGGVGRGGRRGQTLLRPQKRPRKCLADPLC